jgi:hypothetical protein
VEHYVTLFDSNFLPQGLALQESLERHAGEHVLWVVCLDARTRAVLDALGKPHVRTIALSEVETPELLAVKPRRSVAEYCWTLTPFAPGFVFDREPSARRVTYLDADMYLLGSPRPLFDELDASGRGVLITEHAYDSEYDQSATSGRFCVQFISFARDAGEPVRQWWAARCLEWCFNRVEDGKFGDQKYLDDWPERFADRVHVLQRLDAIQAPWNARRFSHRAALAWHFHGLRVQGDRIRWYSGYEIPAAVEADLYVPYVELIERTLHRLGHPVDQPHGKSGGFALARWGRSLARTLWPRRLPEKTTSLRPPRSARP